jgi:hypothetical protein
MKGAGVGARLPETITLEQKIQRTIAAQSRAS